PGGFHTPLTLLADALEAGSLEVTEVDENGVVGELIAINRGPTPVLILDGEQLIGAKQNRTTSRTIVVAASQRTAIPVSCMEQGRWRHVSASMKHGGEHSPSSVRRHARRVEGEDAARESDEVARPREPGAHRRRASSPSELLAMAQGDVWHSVAESSHRSGVYSETGALDHVYAQRREGLEERAARFPSEPGQVGLMAFLYGAPVGLDLLPDAGVYERVHERLVRAYLFESADAAADRPDHGEYAGSVDVSCPDRDVFLAAALEATRIPRETVGLGTYSVVSGPDIFGAELALDGELVHLSAFNGVE
ncbi:MAG: ARPP-1 family domain-containing protein, partial [Gemmatimonadota bacterium]